MRNVCLKQVLGKDNSSLEKTCMVGMCGIHDCVNMFALNLYFCPPTQVTISMHCNFESMS